MNEELLCQSLFYKESYFSFNQAFLFLTLVRSVFHLGEEKKNKTQLYFFGRF